VISNPPAQWADDDWCDDVPVERMRWFTGRFMTARDLTDEQRYLVGRRWLLNRVLHGEGVACGLEVRRDERPECATTTVWLEPGIALDCRGRELISLCRQCVTWPATAEPGCDPPPREERLLVIRYRERAIDPQYALLDDCAAPGTKQPTRVREEVEWKLATREELWHCWPQERPRVHDDCDDQDGGPCDHGGCVEPHCRCGGWVPLVLLTRHDGSEIRVSEPLSGRLPAAGYLTKIARVSWEHGGELELDQLIERHGRLEVDFDRPLLAADGDARGINSFTFRVEFGGLDRIMELMPSAEDSPAVEDRTRAVFTIARELWDPEHRDQRQRDRRGQYRASLRGAYVVVTLLCDFILDCHGNPVDGDHLGGRLPSGNGTPGGVFRSWFAVS
jgi:hypothetical protein